MLNISQISLLSLGERPLLLDNPMFDIDFSVANISENSLYQFLPEILEILLKDRTTSFYSKKKKNIIWANDNYIGLGKKYGETCPITPDLITGNQGNFNYSQSFKIQSTTKRTHQI